MEEETNPRMRRWSSTSVGAVGVGSLGLSWRVGLEDGQAKLTIIFQTNVERDPLIVAPSVNLPMPTLDVVERLLPEVIDEALFGGGAPKFGKRPPGYLTGEMVSPGLILHRNVYECRSLIREASDDPQRTQSAPTPQPVPGWFPRERSTEESQSSPAAPAMIVIGRTLDGALLVVKP